MVHLRESVSSGRRWRYSKTTSAPGADSRKARPRPTGVVGHLYAPGSAAAMKSVTNRDAGFALLDLLTGMAVAGLAASLLVGLVAFVGRNHSDVERRSREYTEILVMERILRTLVSGSPAFLPEASKVSAISGTEREIVIKSAGLPVLGYPRSTFYVLSQGRQKTGSNVTLRWKDENGEERQEVLLHNAFSFNLSYLPRGNGAMSLGWRSNWRAEDGILSAVRLTFQTMSVPAARTIVAPIYATLPATCLRKPRQVGCAVERE